MNKISVIIPIYNVEMYLERCLTSIINNTYKNLEIICINDGSTDNSLGILRRFEKADRRVIVINKENGGLSSARNAGLDIATGDYISFIDSDDWIHHSFFEILLHFAETSKCEISTCNYIFTRNMTEPEKPINMAGVSVKMLSGDSIVLDRESMQGYVWRCLFKKECIGKIRFPAIQIEDGPFTLMVIGRGNGSLSLCKIDATLYYYYQRDDSLIRQFTPYSRLEVVKYVIDHLRENIPMGDRRLCLLYICKYFLSYRYGVMFDMNQELKKDIKSTAKDLLKAIAVPCGMSLKWRSIFTVMLMLPGLYRFYRIYDDPTLLTWEEKKKRGEIPYGYISR